MWQDRIQLAFSTLHYREYPLGRALEGIRKAGYDFISFGTTHEGAPVPSHTMTDEEIAQIKGRIADAGLQARSGIIGHGVRITEDGGVDAFRRELDQFAALGCERLVAAGPWYYAKWPTEIMPPDEWQAACDAWYGAMEKALPHAEALGVIICVKPHTGLCGHSGLVMPVLKRLPSPSLKVCWDAGNVSFYEGVCPDPGLPAIAEHVKCVCLKDHRGPRANPVFPPLGEGNVDHDEYFALLAAAGFDGVMMIEKAGQREDEQSLTPEQTDRRAAEVRAFLEPLFAKHFGDASDRSHI